MLLSFRIPKIIGNLLALFKPDGTLAAMASSLNNIAAMLPGAPLFVKLWGSHSHNTNVEGSDYDYLAVYQAGLQDVLSVQGAKETVEHKKPDLEAHEAAKFCRLQEELPP
jgi:hypothetical protein